MLQKIPNQSFKNENVSFVQQPVIASFDNSILKLLHFFLKSLNF